MADSTRPTSIRPTGTIAPDWPAPTPGDCLGRTCLKWNADGDLTAVDLSLVLERLAAVDGQMTALQSAAQLDACPLIS